jgi:hypothetical protein
MTPQNQKQNSARGEKSCEFLEPGVEGGEGALTDHLVTEFLVAHFASGGLVELLQQIEGDVGGLEMRGVSPADVMDE